MPVYMKPEKKLQKEALENFCFEHNLTLIPDIKYKDFVVKKDNIYLFRASLHPEKKHFGVRFNTGHFADYTYTQEKVLRLIDKLVKDRGDRKTTLPSDYSKEKHLIDD